MTTQCSHPTFHGPTPAGLWVCNKCGTEVNSPVRDWVGRNVGPLDIPTQATSVEADPRIPLPGTEDCEATIKVADESYGCDLAPPHTGHPHSSRAAGVQWVSE